MFQCKIFSPGRILVPLKTYYGKTKMDFVGLELKDNWEVLIVSRKIEKQYFLN